jgi:oligopeptidase B
LPSHRQGTAPDVSSSEIMNRDANSSGASLSPSRANNELLQPPLALREPVEHVIHGDRRVDHYAWLRKKEDPRVISYLEEENAYADSYLASTKDFQEKLYQEMLGRILQTDLSVPYTLRGYEYFTKTEECKQYPLYYRKKLARPSGAVPQSDHGGSVDTELLLDLNALAEGHSYLGLGVFEVSDNNQFLAFATDTNGFRQYTLEVRDLASGSLLPFHAERVTSAAWASDSRTLFYSVEDEVTKRSWRVYRHQFAQTSEINKIPDELLYEEKDERFRVDVERSRSGAYLFLQSNSHTASEIRYLRADHPDGLFKLIYDRKEDHEYFVDHHPGSSLEPAGGVFFIRTNSNGRTYRLMTAPATHPGRENWHEVIEIRPGVMLSGLEVFRTHLVLVEREDGLPYLRILDLTRPAPSALAASQRIEFAEPVYNAALGANPEFDSGHVRFHYESFITPKSVYDYDVATGQRTLRKQQPVLGGYDATLYRTERQHAIAPDGKRIPVSLVYRHDTPCDASAPLLLYGYGSYGISIPINFNSNRLSLLDRGFIFAIAHIRGGGELGKPWHDAGRMHEKMNTFTDFIASAEHLIAEHYTSSEKLSIEGGSAGGLLMGAVCNMRPDLFHAVISHVPFVDVLNTMLDASLPLTVGEFEEWGNPQFENDYFYMKRYCPYTNLERKSYPRMLMKTGLNDSQVMYWEPAKYVAKLRTLKLDTNPLLFKINMGAGHGGASGRYDYLREIALDYAFLLTHLDLSS